MKGKTMLMAAMLAATVMACSAFTGCATMQSQHQKIAVACEGAATAADSIAVATENGRLTTEQANQALAVYQVTVPFCQPVPLSTLSDIDYAALIAASAKLAAISENAR
jgi:hypothetical protein